MASMHPHTTRTSDRPHWLRGERVRSLLHLYLHLAGFMATTILITWGLFFLFFMAIGGFSFDGMMLQLANISARYVAATPTRVATFKIIVLIGHVLLCAAVILLRRGSLLPRPIDDGSRDHG